MGTTCTIGVSIAVPEPYGSLLQQCRAGFGDLAAHAIPTHITLLPPTEVDRARLPVCREHLAAVAATARPFGLRLAGTGTFRPMTPVVYLRLADGAADCAELQERVRVGPLARTLPFPYHPHVTVAHGIPDEALDRAQRELAGFTATWSVTGFSLYEQGPDGIWRPEGDYPFGPQGRGPGVPAQSAGPASEGLPGGRMVPAAGARPEAGGTC